MLCYHHHLVAIFTRTSVLVIYIVSDLTKEASQLRVSRCVHSDTVACLVNRGKVRKIKGGISFSEVT